MRVKIWIGAVYKELILGNANDITGQKRNENLKTRFDGDQENVIHINYYNDELDKKVKRMHVHNKYY